MAAVITRVVTVICTDTCEAVQSTLHPEPVFDTEVGVDLGNVLYEEASVEFLLAYQVKHPNLGEERFSH